jgi:hypothetical protein
MFFSSSSLNIQVIIFLLCVAFVISIVFFLMSKKILVAISAFSLMSNVVINGNVDYNFAKMFDVLWLFYFSLNIWPYINVFLFLIIIFKYFKNKNFKKNEK